jgi:hypothetical protein
VEADVPAIRSRRSGIGFALQRAGLRGRAAAGI